MQEEVKVTVIATGFDEQQVMLPETQQPEIKTDAYGYRPTVNQNATPPIEPKRDNFDIPTFIRRKAD
jgi:hypothetical protein